MSKPVGYDFCGWVTKNDVPCSDGRIIKRDAFAHQDGMKVPMVYMHQQRDASQLLGYTILENRPEGVYGYSYCNDTENGKNIKEAVRHGDVNAYSIFADGLKEKARQVMHGMIKEVSVVLSGANKKATIEEVCLAHYDSDDNIEYDAIIVQGDSDMNYSDTKNELSHEDKEPEDNEASLDKKTIDDVVKTLNEEQKVVVGFLIEMAKRKARQQSSDDEELEDDEVKHYDYEEGEEDMKMNVFDDETTVARSYLSHSDIKEIFSDAQKGKGSLKEVYEEKVSTLCHDDSDHGIERSEGDQTYFVNDPSFLFPEARELNGSPEFIKRPDDWVSVVMSGVHRTPFSRVKTQFADITEDVARAKGYIKGKRKKEEVFTLLKRTTTPQTVYKFQKMDRDDQLDITDFDKVAWLKSEMRSMLEEECARAILVGDGRSTSDDDHISEDHIRPIWSDASLFTIRKTVDVTNPKNIIDEAIRARKEYRGSGNPIMFTTEDVLTELLLLEDKMGHKLYKTEQELATAIRASRIVTVPIMENLIKDGKQVDAIFINLKDYNVGADNGGQVNLFDDFDIRYNQNLYLIETRFSGALIKPFSAIVLEHTASSGDSTEDSNNGEG